MASTTFVPAKLKDADAIRTTLLEGCTIGLFTASHTVDEDDDLSDYEAIEAAWTGYARQTPASWSAAVTDGSDHAVMFADPVSFPVTSGGTGESAYGYFILDVDGDLHHAEEFSTPIAITDGVPLSFIAEYWVQLP